MKKSASYSLSLHNKPSKLILRVVKTNREKRIRGTKKRTLFLQILKQQRDMTVERQDFLNASDAKLKANDLHESQDRKRDMK
jgi:hypothetical protein